MIMNEVNPRFYGECPFCHKYIELKARKDFESFTNNEVLVHMQKMHEVDYAVYKMQHAFGFPYMEIKEHDELKRGQILG